MSNSQQTSAPAKKRTEEDGKLSALSWAQAVIEFTPDGRILEENHNFLSVLGYSACGDCSQQQAAVLEETSAALNEMTATVQSLTASAEETRKLVQTARASTISSTAIVNDTMAAMDEIAFQTNPLALNAGHESGSRR